MAFKREQHSVGHSQSAENAPAVQQAHLAGAQAFFVRVQDLAVVQLKAMHMINFSSDRQARAERRYLHETTSPPVTIRLRIAGLARSNSTAASLRS